MKQTSLSAFPVDSYIVDDPRIDLDNYGCYLIERSATDITYYTEAAQSASTSGLAFSVQPPSTSTVVSSKVFVHYEFIVRITGADLGIPIDEGCAPRFCSLLQLCSGIDLTLNGTKFTENIEYYIAALMRYNNNLQEMTYDFSTFPSFLDTYAEYYDPSKALPTYQASWGTPLDPLSSVGASTPYTPSPRRAWFQNSRCERRLVPGDPTARTSIDWVITGEEMIPLSPLFWGHEDKKGLIQITNLNLVLNFGAAKLNRMISTRRYGMVTYNGNPVNSDLTLTTTINSKSNNYISLVYLTPRKTPLPIPPVNRYPYHNIIVNTQQVSGAPHATYESMGGAGAGCIVTAGATKTLTMGSLQLSSIPKRIYIFARRDDNAFVNGALTGFGYNTPQATDTFARIVNISMQFGNKANQLADATPETLYRMSVRNGYKGTWDDWWCRSGGVLCLDLSRDIGLPEAAAPGVLGSTQFSFTLTIASLFSDRSSNDVANPANVVDTNFMAYSVVVYDGMTTIANNQVIQEIGVLSPLDTLATDEEELRRKIPYDELRNYYAGGTHGGDLKNIFNKARNVYDRIKPYAEKAAPYVKKAYDLATSPAAKTVYKLLPGLLALGYTEDQAYKILAVKKGGALMSKSEVKKRSKKLM